MCSLFDAAVKAYAEYCEMNGYIVSQPSESESIVDEAEGFVYLENTNGPLANYEIATGEVTAP